MSDWRELEFEEDGGIVLPSGLEFVWVATRKTSGEGVFLPWELVCARVSDLDEVYRRFETTSGYRRSELLWRPAETPPLPNAEPCTGLSAVWCPNCGDCSCPTEHGERSSSGESCLLHGTSSQHGESR